MKEIVLDTETTGLSVKDGHRIVEIGCIEIENLIPTKNVFHCYLNPERKVSESALKVHGYTDEFLSDKKFFKDIANDFLEFIKDKNNINDFIYMLFLSFLLVFTTLNTSQNTLEIHPKHAPNTPPNIKKKHCSREQIVHSEVA